MAEFPRAAEISETYGRSVANLGQAEIFEMLFWTGIFEILAKTLPMVQVKITSVININQRTFQGWNVRSTFLQIVSEN